MIRRIRSLLYEQGYTIGAARLRLKEQPRVDAIVAVIEPLVLPTTATNSSRRAELRDIRTELESLLNRWPV